MQVNATPILSLPCSQALGPYLRVIRDGTYGLAAAGPEDRELGTTNTRHVVTGLGSSTRAAVVSPNAPGTIRMVASEAITIYDYVYGSTAGKVSTTPNANPIGIALSAASADGAYVEVLRLAGLDVGSDDEVGGLQLFDHFIGDYPAAATALTGNDWTKVETNGLGVTSSDQANGVLKFELDATSEAATAALYMINAPFDAQGQIVFEARVAIYDIGDTATDFNIGLANDTHATSFDSITEYIAIHLDGAALSILAQSTDGTTTVAATDTLVDAVDDTFFIVKIDCTDLSDCKIYIDGTRVLAATTFDISQITGTLTPIVHLEKTTSTDTADLRVDWIRCRAQSA